MSLLYNLVLLLVCTSLMKSILGRTEAGVDVRNRILWPWHRTYVRITNNIEDKSSFTIHCKSKDDDLGIHVIEAGETYQWKFHINFFRTTLFYCNAAWKGKFVNFDSYSVRRDYSRCGKDCIWRVFEDGVHGYRGETQQEDIFFMWSEP